MYGDHCPNCDTGHIDFQCPNHPLLRWHGKNIFGRSLFFDQITSWRNVATAEGWVAKGPDDNSCFDATGRVIRECECRGRLLFHRCPVDGKAYRNGQVVSIAPYVFAPYDVLQVLRKGAWLDFSTLRTNEDAGRALALVETGMWEGERLAFRIRRNDEVVMTEVPNDR